MELTISRVDPCTATNWELTEEEWELLWSDEEAGPGE